jgi:hypothetical protein
MREIWPAALKSANDSAESEYLKGFPHVCRNPLRPIPNLTPCPSSTAARESISVAILLDLSRKKKVMMG